MYPAGRDGAVCSKRIVGYAMTGTHANRPASKTLCKIGGSELPAHQGCDDSPIQVRGHKVHVRRVHHHEQVWHPRLRWEEPACATYSAAADIIQRHPCRKELDNQQDLLHQKKSNQRSWHHGLNTDCDQTRFHSSLGYRTPNEVRQDMGENQDGSLNHNSSFSLPSTKPMAVQS